MAGLTEVRAPEVRYEIMDALRGIAAVAVVFYHFGSRLGLPETVAHGYLAVDFFFMLSGFVLAHAYTRKLSSLSVARFALIRAVRLLPMSVFGVLIGTAYFLLRWKIQNASSDSVLQILGASGLNLALIPKLWSAGATKDEVFPADGVLWSLSFEFLINVAWAAGLIRLKPQVQLGIAFIGAMVMIYYIWEIGNANLGWNWSTYVGGLGRTVFGFLIGLILWRYRPIVRPSGIKPLLVTALLILALSLPLISRIYEIVVVILIFPLIIYLAASADFGAESAFVKFLADISYPLYAVHLPILMALSGTLKLFTRNGSHPPAFLYALSVPIILLAWCLGHWYELPARRWLERLFLQKRPLQAPA